MSNKLSGLDEIESFPLANLLGTKLRAVFDKHQANATASFVFGACDAVMANEFTESGAGKTVCRVSVAEH